MSESRSHGGGGGGASPALAPAPAVPRPLNGRVPMPLMVTLALLAAAAPFGTDMYLPAFPAMVRELSTSSAGVQLSMTGFLVGAGAGQLIFGPLSDRIGRVPPLLVGVIVYVLAGAGAALSPNIQVLVAARLLQGLSGAAGMVIGRAIIADLTSGRQAVRAFNLLQLVGGLAPIVAPITGSLLAGPLGWRGLMWIVTGIGAIAAVLVFAIVRETNPARSQSPQPPPFRTLLAHLRSRAFIGATLACAFGFATMMAYISASSFLYQEMMGLSIVVYALLFGLNATMLMAGSGVAARLAHRFTAAAVARVGLLINFTAILVIVIFAFTPVPALWLALPILIAVGSLGLVLGNTTAMALAASARSSGLGSAILGMTQFAVAGAVAPLVTLAGSRSAVPLALVMLVASIAALGAFALAVSTPHQRPATPATEHEG
jgi:DHA1 family bicyclomycin/chloramphenicol resistance-like MFS transporter